MTQDGVRPALLLRTGWFVSLLGLALAVRLVAALGVHSVVARTGRTLLFPDSARYADVGARLAREGILEDRRGNRAGTPPGYPTLLAAVWRIGGSIPSASGAPSGEAVLSARLVQSFLGTCSVAGGMMLAWALGGARPAFLAGIALALWPHGIGYDAMLLSESLAVFLLMLQLVLLRMRSWERLGAWRALAAGLAGSALAVTRPSMLLVACAPVVPLLVLRHRVGCVCVVAFLSGLGAGMAPWLIRNAVVLGAFPVVGTRAGHDLYVALGPEAYGGPVNRYDWAALEGGRGEVAADRHLIRLALGEVLKDPARAMRLVPVKWGRFWNPFPNPHGWRHAAICAATSVAILLWLPLAPSGLRRLDPPDRILMAGPVVALWLVHSIWIASVRYRLPLEPLLAVLAAVAVSSPRATAFPTPVRSRGASRAGTD